MNMYYVYILKNEDKGSYYIGFSENLKDRIKSHVSKTVKTTKGSSDLRLVFYSAFKTKQKALAFERYLKSGSGFAFRNKHLV